MDKDLKHLDREALIEEVVKLRAAIREHRDSSGHELDALSSDAEARSSRGTIAMVPLRSLAVGAAAAGACALGAVAIGALAIGRLGIGRLALKRARVGAITVDELTIGRLHVRES
jgi:hypothetical protein